MASPITDPEALMEIALAERRRWYMERLNALYQKRLDEGDDRWGAGVEPPDLFRARHRAIALAVRDAVCPPDTHVVVPKAELAACEALIAALEAVVAGQAALLVASQIGSNRVATTAIAKLDKACAHLELARIAKEAAHG